jgi:hypothetical protein
VILFIISGYIFLKLVTCADLTPRPLRGEGA